MKGKYYLSNILILLFILVSCLSVTAETADELLQQGKSLEDQGKYEEAIACYDKVIEIDSNNEEAWSSKGFSLHSLGRYEEALACYDKAMEINPDNFEIYLYKQITLAAMVQNANTTPPDNTVTNNTVTNNTQNNSLSIEIKKPLDLNQTKALETSDGKVTVEGVVQAGETLGAFEIYSYTGNNQDNPDWREKGPHAVGKTSFFFSQEINLQAGLNYIGIRAVDATGNEIIKEYPVLYTPGEVNKWAVVIGIGEYANPGVGNLKYSAKDAQSFYDYLITEGGFPQDNVLLLLNEKATLVGIKTALGKFLQEKAMKDDLVFIYYSGHGAPEINSSSTDGDGLTKYIVTYDADPDNLFATALPMDDINKIFERLQAGKIVFFIDSCYSGASGGKTFAAGDVKAGNISDNFLNQISSAKGRLLITASSANEVALESDTLGHGIFTYFLLQGLEGEADTNKNGFVTVDEVYQYLYSNVSKESGNRQHPVKKGEAEGEIILGQTGN